MHDASSYRKLALCAAIAFVLWHLPAPSGFVDVDGIYSPLAEPASSSARTLTEGWHLLAIFCASVVGFLVRALAMGAIVVLALVALAATRTLRFEQVLAGFGDETVWLVVAAFLLAGNVVRSGLGTRLALTLVVKLGRSPLGLAYALCASEMVLGTLIPSNTARGGGILAPIVRSLAIALGSEPGASPRRAGAFLVLVGAHANLIASAMYLTAMAANPLIRRAAVEVYGVDFGWGTWLLGAIVPAMMSFAVLPLVIAKLEPPNAVDVSAARQSARDQLQTLGRWQAPEKAMALVGAALVLLWMTKPLHGLGAALVAWVGVGALLFVGAERWNQVLENAGAWDSLIWVGGLLTMATQLRELGIVGWFGHLVQSSVSGLSGGVALLVLLLVYFYSMYGFSMLTAHIAAMVGAFLAIAKMGAFPPLVAIASMAYVSNLCACLTPYSSGPVIIYFGQGYVSTGRWFYVGLVISFFHLLIWLVGGALWWKLLGWW